MPGFANRMRTSRVWGVLAVYLGASWVVLQIVDVVKQNLGLPDWVFPFALLLLLIGHGLAFLLRRLFSASIAFSLGRRIRRRRLGLRRCGRIGHSERTGNLAAASLVIED